MDITQELGKPVNRLTTMTLSVLSVIGFLLLLPLWWAYWTMSALGATVSRRSKVRATSSPAPVATPVAPASAALTSGS